VGLESVLQSSFLTVPDLGCAVLRRTDKVRTMGMEVDALDWALVSLVNLYDMLGTKVVEFNLLVVGAGGNAVSEGVKLDLVDDSIVFLVGLDGLLGGEVPDVDEFVVAGD
jgi:hypothetical protein